MEHTETMNYHLPPIPRKSPKSRRTIYAVPSHVRREKPGRYRLRGFEVRGRQLFICSPG